MGSPFVQYSRKFHSVKVEGLHLDKSATGNLGKHARRCWKSNVVGAALEANRLKEAREAFFFFLFSPRVTNVSRPRFFKGLRL